MTHTIMNLMRLHGRYYTPSFVVDAMLRLALDPLLESRSPTQSSPPRILDPACGDGAFLLAAAERLRAWYARHGVVRDSRMDSHLFGVDIDQAALTSLLSQWEPACGLGQTSGANVCWGDALTGPGFGESAHSLTAHAEEGLSVPDLDWSAAFPDAALAGGFDLVIGNPPYRRELAWKQTMDRLKRSPLGQRWHQPRLDLWAYFLHRGLDVLRPGGRLAFILPSYWTASTAARQLIDRLEAESTLRDIILLGKSPVFPKVAGWHLILSLVKGREENPCQVWDLSNAGNRVAEQLSRLPKSPTYSIKRAELFQHGQLRLSPRDHRVQIMVRQPATTLEERFEVRQGIVENPRRITRAMAASSAQPYQVGEGVFVLSAEERDKLALAPEEQRLLRPYYQGTEIERYSLAESPAEWLLYLTRETAADLEAFPKIRAHLARFRPLLENRREVQRGRIAWWHLHWPREEALFLAPRIVMPQMGIEPRFVLCEKPAFVGFAMHVIRQRPIEGTGGSCSLWALTGVLNSALAGRWFQQEAKHRGAALDISGTVLNRFPLPPANREAESSLAKLVQARQALPAGSMQIPDLEEKIESVLRKWYSL